MSAAIHSDEDFLLSSEFKELSHEYVRLHLVEELRNAANLFENENGREILRAWLEKRDSIIQKVLSSHDGTKDNFMMRLNWRQYWERFQHLQTDYFKTLVLNYDVRRSESPWPKMSFIVDKNFGSRVIEHPNELRKPREMERLLADPFVDDVEIDRALKFQKPFTKNEWIELKKIESKKLDETPTKTYVLPDYVILTFQNDDGTLKKLHIKKYEIIDNNLIRKLQETRFKLLSDSLKYKRMSYLHYQEALYQAERVANQFQVWKRIDSTCKNYDKVPNYLRIIKDDEAYRKFFNHLDSFFPGNLMYGHNDRYDHPTDFDDFNFESNARTIIGKRFKPMRNLFDELRTFYYSSQGFSLCNLADFPLIESYLDRFKRWTFTFLPEQFDSRKWTEMSIKQLEDVKFHMIKLRNFPSKNPVEILAEVNRILQEKRKPLVRDVIGESNYLRSLRFEMQLYKDAWSMKLFLMTNNKFTIWTSTMTRYLNSFNTANALESLVTKSVKHLSSTGYSSLIKVTSKDNPDDVKSNKNNKPKNENEESELKRFEHKIKTTFDFVNDIEPDLITKNTEVNIDVTYGKSPDSNENGPHKYGNGGDNGDHLADHHHSNSHNKMKLKHHA